MPVGGWQTEERRAVIPILSGIFFRDDSFKVRVLYPVNGTTAGFFFTLADALQTSEGRKNLYSKLLDDPRKIRVFRF